MSKSDADHESFNDDSSESDSSLSDFLVDSSDEDVQFKVTRYNVTRQRAPKRKLNLKEPPRKQTKIIEIRKPEFQFIKEKEFNQEKAHEFDVVTVCFGRGTKGRCYVGPKDVPVQITTSTRVLGSALFVGLKGEGIRQVAQHESGVYVLAGIVLYDLY
jgi:hypothetical protein